MKFLSPYCRYKDTISDKVQDLDKMLIMKNYGDTMKKIHHLYFVSLRSQIKRKQ